MSKQTSDVILAVIRVSCRLSVEGTLPDELLPIKNALGIRVVELAEKIRTPIPSDRDYRFSVAWARLDSRAVASVD